MGSKSKEYSYVATIQCRTNLIFETASKYSWINGIFAIGIGYRTPAGAVYNVFEILQGSLVVDFFRSPTPCRSDSDSFSSAGCMRFQ